ncbi:tRNA lysidine(34) synthetase TilS [Acetomicrobium flavidum]|uniref:tRNA lysidine(34) synthetase TilS n=1 Tax=Acetomicrobium flavidum TaxID=49896 RepID=UPI002989F4F9
MEKVNTSKCIPKWIMDNYYPKFKAVGIRQGWWNSSGPIVAGVSGGPDSVALLWLLVNLWRGKVIVAHFEHGIRGEDSLEDAAFVRGLATELRCPFLMESVPVPKCRQRGESVEEAARRLRYAFLEQVREKYGASCIAVGHHKDDLVETVLFNVIRGTGIRGVRGIPEKRGYIVRPLIEFFRSEIIELLKGLEMAWREDSTNIDIDYTRNKIRLQLIPLLESEYNPKIKEHIASLSRQACDITDRLERDASSINEVLRRNPLPYAMATWDRKILQSVNLPPHLLAECIRKQQRDLGLTTLSGNRTELLVGLIRERLNWRFQWEKRIEVCADRDFISWVDWDIETRSPSVSIDLRSQPSGELFWNGWEFHWNMSDRTDMPKFGMYQCCVSICDEMDLPLQIVSIKEAHRLIDDFFDPVPWWSKQVWPIFILSCKMWWIPLYGGSCKVRDADRSLKRVRIKAEYKKSERM